MLTALILAASEGDTFGWPEAVVCVAALIAAAIIIRR